MEIDLTTDQILAEKETFEILAERGYETLLDYNENGKDPKRKIQEYEKQ